MSREFGFFNVKKFFLSKEKKSNGKSNCIIANGTKRGNGKFNGTKSEVKTLPWGNSMERTQRSKTANGKIKVKLFDAKKKKQRGKKWFSV